MQIKQIYYASHQEAMNVLELLGDTLNKYGYATLADYYELSGVDAGNLDARQGWLASDGLLPKEDIVEKTANGFVLNLAEPIPLYGRTAPRRNHSFRGAVPRRPERVTPEDRAVGEYIHREIYAAYKPEVFQGNTLKMTLDGFIEEAVRTMDENRESLIYQYMKQTGLKASQIELVQDNQTEEDKIVFYCRAKPGVYETIKTDGDFDMEEVKSLLKDYMKSHPELHEELEGSTYTGALKSIMRKANDNTDLINQIEDLLTNRD